MMMYQRDNSSSFMTPMGKNYTSRPDPNVLTHNQLMYASSLYFSNTQVMSDVVISQDVGELVVRKSSEIEKSQVIGND